MGSTLHLCRPHASSNKTIVSGSIVDVLTKKILFWIQLQTLELPVIVFSFFFKIIILMIIMLYWNPYPQKEFILLSVKLQNGCKDRKIMPESNRHK